MTATLILDDARRFDLKLNAGRRYQAIVARPELKAELMRKLAEAAPIAVVAGEGSLVGNLKVWENLVLPVAYSGRAPLEELEGRAERLFCDFGILRERFAELCVLLPERLSAFEQRLTVFVRAMLTEPEIMVYDELFEGLARAEAEKAARFDSVFQLHFPFRTALFLDAEDLGLAAASPDATFRL